eukprot:12458238-Ditylum_brightwellii.AAC.1
MHIIMIYKADYAILLGLAWRTHIQSVEKRVTINEGLYGGRKGRDATTISLLEELKNNICYTTRKSLTTFDNNAASCYDMFIPSFSTMGVSKESYLHNNLYPIYGIGQGSMNSPNILLVNSSTLAQNYDDEVHGATFVSPDKQINAKVTLLGLVDDATNQVNEFLNNKVTAQELD